MKTLSTVSKLVEVYFMSICSKNRVSLTLWRAVSLKVLQFSRMSSVTSSTLSLEELQMLILKEHYQKRITLFSDHMLVNSAVKRLQNFWRIFLTTEMNLMMVLLQKMSQWVKKMKLEDLPLISRVVLWNKGYV